ncbi:hypothetical protein BVC80_37g5 [Macleaya cordata]|uniref:Choline monooxygenase, chloroplastic n=1 Tax=Macleaya cordata TaxID=56857 RepID=A0A200QAN8_MACCD|nr:hypothetical protein BVC80_37g5 [Macleaya cordata]
MQMGKFKLFTMYVDIMPLFLLLAVDKSLALYALIMDGLMGWTVHSSRLQEYQEYKTLMSMYAEFGLIPLQVATWGPFILINLDENIQPQQRADSKMVENEWLGNCSEILSTNGIDSSLSFVCRREYTIECNWKVFCDNYLDGGYHVPYAHTGLASGLKLDSYSTTIFDKVSIQACESGPEEGGDDDRLGSKALYAFIYPNFMINRYGPWMDTNLVLPLGPNKCQVIFDYFLEASLKDDKAFINQSLEESERVQVFKRDLNHRHIPVAGVDFNVMSACQGISLRQYAMSASLCLGRGRNYMITPWCKVAPSRETGATTSSIFQACKSLRRRCPEDCVLAPYFPSTDPQRFSCVHKIFGASNITKMLQRLPGNQRSDAADCMSIEATWRVRDPVYGCVGIISQLQQQIIMVQRELTKTQGEIAFHNAHAAQHQPQLSQQLQEQQQQQMGGIGTQEVQLQLGEPSSFNASQQDMVNLDQQHLLDFYQ